MKLLRNDIFLLDVFCAKAQRQQQVFICAKAQRQQQPPMLVTKESPTLHSNQLLCITYGLTIVIPNF
ncbi:hypothetical protein [Lysinibacillus sp. NPDC056232]|uniref:hypothetical protein n=1 Tax=Lysinibacillus sp. NPDC056232 TaxID=3345756 RepID=UPI0035E1BA84